MGNNAMVWSEKFFDEILRSRGVEAVTESAARDVLAEAKATAPVGKVNGGRYRDSIKMVKVNARHRSVWRVVATAPYSMVVESRTGNLARALKKVRLA